MLILSRNKSFHHHKPLMWQRVWETGRIGWHCLSGNSDGSFDPAVSPKVTSSQGAETAGWRRSVCVSIRRAGDIIRASPAGAILGGCSVL